MTRIESQISGVGSNRSTNCATTTAHLGTKDTTSALLGTKTKFEAQNET